MGVDPGGTTGVAVYNTVGRCCEMWEQIESGGAKDDTGMGWHRKEQEVGSAIATLVWTWLPDVIVIEDFILGHGSGVGDTAERAGLSAVRVTSVLMTWLLNVLPEDEDWYGPKIMLSNASNKNVIKDATLKRLGLWVPGRRHANDALLHCLWAERKVAGNVARKRVGLSVVK
jgi:hypothetical protein